MTEQEKQLLLKDLCCRLPYNFVYLYTNAPLAEGRPIILTPVVISNLMNATNDLVLKPYLRPMSSMTEEERKEMVKLHIDDRCCLHIEECDANCVDFYHSHHLDYRGLIPMGLAIEAPEGMYND